jgi:hypothetical protein
MAVVVVVHEEPGRDANRVSAVKIPSTTRHAVVIERVGNQIEITMFS